MTKQTGESKYDLFISYADDDRSWVEGYLVDALAQAGVRYHSEAAFALGMPRLLEFERAVQQSQRTLIVLSSAYMAEGFSRFADLLAQSYGLETATWPVIPLRLEPVELPPRLATLIALDVTDSARWPAAIERLCAELQFPVPSPPPRPPCPYPGMVPFSPKEARFFYGREDEIRGMIQHLRHQRYLFVIGPSGSGKSSLVLAGLLPRLVQSPYFSEGFWLVREMRPGNQSVQAIAEAIGGDIARLAQAVADLLDNHPPAQRLLLVIDQFEELFNQVTHPERSRFITILEALRSLEECALILVMRADFYPDLMNSDLWPVDHSQRLEIAPLRGEKLRQAVYQPATDVGVYLEMGLLERLLTDAADEPGALPLVQETMVLLWGEMERRLLTIRAYEQLGGKGRNGLAGAVAAKADAALAQVTPTQRAIARRIFLRLVQFGEGRPDTRRQQLVAALRSADDDPSLFDRVLSHLANNRLLTLSGEGKDEHKRVDIAHEALIEGWPTLQTWLAERREAEQTRRRLEARATDWVHAGRGEAGLLDKVQLLGAERWRTSPDAVELGYSEDLAALVQASHEAVEAAEREKEAAHQRELELIDSLAKAREESFAAQQLATLGTTVAALQHRITSTLSIILPNIRRLRGRADLSDETVREILDIIERSVSYSSQTVSRTMESFKDSSVQRVNTNVLIADVARELEEKYLARGGINEIAITLDLEEPLPEILAVTGHISEVFRTLIENSFDAMEETGGEVTITSRFQDDNIVVEVKDTGPGIPANVVDKVFHQPVSSDKPGESTGIGLWLTGLLLQRYGGRATIERTGPHGTSMLVKLPASSSSPIAP